MTVDELEKLPEELSKLEALHAAATPPTWHTDSTGGLVQTNHITRDVWTIPRTQADLDCIAALHNAFPKLAAGLRTALERCETLQQIADQMSYSAGLSARRMEQAQDARDEARAEVEMIRGVGCGELREGAEIEDGPCGACLKCARRERDEARAEVERLRDLIDTVIRSCMECYDKWECQSCAWLREGTKQALTLDTQAAKR